MKFSLRVLLIQKRVFALAVVENRKSSFSARLNAYIYPYGIPVRLVSLGRSCR